MKKLTTRSQKRSFRYLFQINWSSSQNMIVSKFEIDSKSWKSKYIWLSSTWENDVWKFTSVFKIIRHTRKRIRISARTKKVDTHFLSEAFHGKSRRIHHQLSYYVYFHQLVTQYNLITQITKLFARHTHYVALPNHWIKYYVSCIVRRSHETAPSRHSEVIPVDSDAIWINI